MVDVGAAGRVDGRSARAERTRGAIVEALLALNHEGDLKPTGERIAERAGVSLRALWANFKDMEALFSAAGQRLLERQDAEYRKISPQLPLKRRVDEFCRQRARMLEIVAPSARAAQLREPFSAALRYSRATNIAWVRRQIEELFAVELDLTGQGREQLFNALTVTCTWSAWSMLRDELELDPDAAQGVMVATMTALLAAAGTAGLR
ncbi:MAG: TetR/AcrR family transcriptional regulator, regulator of autoinduction and epiphytic fitness [Micromonosporaceae bacterium]|jgi:AcrR family transcriptional regulator|nr:TetR/AcrR family transcriptional regulator, regulator of autoinduction and epiphytic fitness [Micromonosporaceae bacterium]